MKKSFGLAVLLVSALTASASAAGPEKLIYDLAFGTTNPCNGSLTSAPGQVKITIQARNDTTWDAKFQFRGDGLDALGGTYRAGFDGADTFGALESPLVVAVAGSFVGRQGAPSFDLSGSVEIPVDANGVPDMAFISIGTFACTAH